MRWRLLVVPCTALSDAEDCSPVARRYFGFMECGVKPPHSINPKRPAALWRPTPHVISGTSRPCDSELSQLGLQDEWFVYVEVAIPAAKRRGWFSVPISPDY